MDCGEPSKSYCGWRFACTVRRLSRPTVHRAGDCRDRKSTRLNSSHGSISYAVFYSVHANRTFPSFPTRRSSDLFRPATDAPDIVLDYEQALCPELTLHTDIHGLRGTLEELLRLALRLHSAATVETYSPSSRRLSRSEEHTSELQSR